MTGLKKAWWWVVGIVAGLGALVLGLFTMGLLRARLWAWYHSERALRAQGRQGRAVATAGRLGAQKAALLHEATKLALAQEVLAGQDQDVVIDLERIEARIRDMGPEEVAAEFNRIQEAKK